MKLRRIPIAGWKRCAHDAASFESPGEFKAARLLDASTGVNWWLRNDPVIFRVPSPAGFFEPDFIYETKVGARVATNVLEVKAENFWDGDGSEPRLKAAALCEWIKAIKETGLNLTWSFHLILEPDVLNSNTLEDMLRKAATGATTN